MKKYDLDSVSLYLEEIGNLQVPTDYENKELIKKYKEGNLEAYKEIFERNLRLVIPYAKKYARENETDLLDTIQNGNLGLAKAIEKFDLNHGTAFSTYAVLWIRNSISRHHLEQGNIVRQPSNRIYTNQRITRFIQEYESKYFKKPTEDEIIKHLNITLYDLKRYYASNNFFLLSLDQPIKEDEISRYDRIESKDNFYNELEQDLDEKILLYKLKENLSNQEYYIIYFRYFSVHPLDLEEIAKIFHCTKQNIFQLEKKILKKIKNIIMKPLDIPIKEILSLNFKPPSFSNYIFFYLLKKSLKEEEYDVYYKKHVLKKTIDETNPFYLKAKKKAEYLRTLKEDKRYEMAMELGTRNQIFEIDIPFLENNKIYQKK